ncbi:hypothetical protein [Leisingera sp. F5]|uniref:hypothetical protein n=1 Tax=Leisingera sp. F5 TaxID=1813816 RepID=UPI000AC3AB84|nr:hypothetical protein [Leisingera sp. F5]
MDKKSFNRAAGGSARPQDRRNAQRKVNSASILTRNRLDKLALAELKEPALELDFDMDGIRAASNAQAREKHRDMIDNLRSRLRSKSSDGRKAFQRSARSQRGERER